MTPGRSRWVVWALATLLVWSFAVRVWDASHGLDATRTYDERFTLRNVTGLLRHGDLRPAHAFYLGLSYYPQTAVLAASHGLYRWTGFEPLAVYAEKGDGARLTSYTPTAFLLCRSLNALFGTLSLWVVFAIGRRLHSPPLGLLAAAILGAFQRHLLSSAHFKPDILVLLLTALTLLWSLAAAWDPSRRRFLAAGCGVGLAVATKYTGLAAALPIAAAVPLFGRRDRRQWLWLVGAGLASIVTFVALNPFLGVVLRFIPKLIQGYAAHGVTERSGHWVVLRRQVEFLWEQHGALVAVFLAVGLGGLLLRLLGRGGDLDRRERIGWTLVLALLLGYSAVHAAAMTLFRGQNYLPVSTASSLVAAWGLIETFAVARRRLAWLAGPTAVVLWIALGGLLLAQQVAVVYGRVIPTNWEAVNGRLLDELSTPGLRHVVYERALGTFSGSGSPRRPLVSPVASLVESDPAFLDRADVEVFPAARLGGPQGAFYRARLERLDRPQVETVAARIGRRRGEPVLVLRHPWEAAAEPEEIPLRLSPDDRGITATLPGLAPGETASLLLWTPRLPHRRWPGARLQPGDRALQLVDTGRRRERYLRLSPRFGPAGPGAPEGPARIEIPVEGVRDLEGWGLELHRWRPGR